MAGGRQSFAYDFYCSINWINCRKAYAKSVGGLCEDCLADGRITPGEIVHHIKPLTPENISDPSIAYGWDNLRFVCRSCHLREHKRGKRRWKIDKYGKCVAL